MFGRCTHILCFLLHLLYFVPLAGSCHCLHGWLLCALWGVPWRHGFCIWVYQILTYPGCSTSDFLGHGLFTLHSLIVAVNHWLFLTSYTALTVFGRRLDRLLHFLLTSGSHHISVLLMRSAGADFDILYDLLILTLTVEATALLRLLLWFLLNFGP